MVDVSSYWTMKVLQADGQLRLNHFSEVQRWFGDRFADVLKTGTISESECQRSLWTIWQTRGQANSQLDTQRNSQRNSQPGAEDCQRAEMSLRCRLSHAIVAVCAQLAGQFGQYYGFTAADLFPLVLDDNGTEGMANRTTKETGEASTYLVCAWTILTQYRPGKGSLGGWASRLVRNNADVNRFLMERGLYLITPWAILNDTQVAQLPRFLPDLSQAELKAAGKLLHAYHRVYRRDRLQKRLRQTIPAKQRCGNPTDEQLRRINPQESANVVFQQLCDLADQLREVRLARRTRTIPPSKLVRLGENDVHRFIETIPAPATDGDDSDDHRVSESFMEQYRHHFRATLDQAIAHIVQTHVDRHRKRDPIKGRLYRDALHLFHREGYSMGAIAQQLGMTNQVAVTRLLQLRQLRQDVGIYWLRQLKQTVLDDLGHQLSAEHVDRISHQVEQVLREDIEGVEKEAAAEAQIPKNRTTNSLFAQRLCVVLTHTVRD